MLIEPFQGPICCGLALPHSAPSCSLPAPSRSFGAPLHSLAAPSKAALLPFLDGNGNYKSYVRGIYNIYIYIKTPPPSPSKNPSGLVAMGPIWTMDPGLLGCFFAISFPRYHAETIETRASTIPFSTCRVRASILHTATSTPPLFHPLLS